jgi:Mg-chelatase subunit ChlD
MRGSCLIGVIVLALAAAAAAQTPVVQFAEPPEGAVVTEPRVVVTGRAEPQTRAAAVFDVVVLIDTSGSTRMPAALAERLGGFSRLLSGPIPLGGKTILDVEVAAAHRFVDVADRTSTRIGLITFADEAALVQSLTNDYDAVRRALERVRQHTPDGGTHMAAGMRLAIRELRALAGAASSGRPDARKVVLLMTDGFPTLPYPAHTTLDPRNVDATLDVVRLAAKGGIVVHTFCLGREALSAPVVCRDAAQITGGAYHAVQRPADIVELLPSTKIGQVDLVSVRNATTGQMARRLDVDATGRFSADIPLTPGPNRLVVQVQGAAPEVAMTTRIVHYRPAGDVDIKVEPPRRPDPEVDIRIERGAPSR